MKRAIGNPLNSRSKNINISQLKMADFISSYVNSVTTNNDWTKIKSANKKKIGKISQSKDCKRGHKKKVAQMKWKLHHAFHGVGLS